MLVVVLVIDGCEGGSGALVCGGPLEELLDKKPKRLRMEAT
jgi:hypothetical protein